MANKRTTRTKAAATPKAGRAGTTNHEYDQAEAPPSRCRRCQSTNREPYFGTPLVKVFEYTKLRPGTNEKYNRQVRRRTRCSDCGQYRFDLSYEYDAALESEFEAKRRRPSESGSDAFTFVADSAAASVQVPIAEHD